MKTTTKIISLTFLLLFITNSLSFARVTEKIEKNFVLTNENLLSVENPSGDITIETWKEKKIYLSATKVVESTETSDAMTMLSKISVGIDFGKESIAIHTKLPADESLWNKILGSQKLLRHDSKSVYVNYLIKIPENFNISLSSTSASITVSNLSGKSIIDTVSGNITVTNLGQTLKLKTITGTITGNAISASVDASTISGDINLTNVTNFVAIDSISGDITLSTDGSISAKTISGDIQWTCLKNISNDAKLKSTSGNLTLYLPETTAANVAIETLTGSVKSELPIKQEFALVVNSSFLGHDIEGKFGIGGKSLTLSTTSGNIIIYKNK